MPRVCECGKRPQYNYRGIKTGIRCIICREPGMVNIYAKRCSCGKITPRFNFPGVKPGICCKVCKTDGMINVMSRKCPCGSQSYFNFQGITPGVCCAKCKTDGMVNVVSNKCPCGKITPKFNFPGISSGVCCDGCKADGMINVMSKKCSCGSQMSFNFPGVKPGICCKVCKTDGMVDVYSIKCPCGTIPTYNSPTETTGVCCRFCKTDDMVDVVNKKCSCGKQRSFNFPGITPGECCIECKRPGMINVCSNICPGYNDQCPVRTQLTRGHKYCMSCDPNEDRRKRFKLYENAFFEYVKGKLDVHTREFHVNFDPTETAKKFARLDGIVFGDGIIVCLEVDENGHKDYDCDDHRMNLVSAELLQKTPGNDITWVRVNPTVKGRDQWSRTSKKIREKRFEEVVDTVNDILKTKGCDIKYIGF